MARNNTQEEVLLASERKVNWPAIVGILSGTAIAAYMITYVPDLPPILGGLIGGCGVYPLIAYAAGYASRGKLTAKGIGAERSGT